MRSKEKVNRNDALSACSAIMERSPRLRCEHALQTRCQQELERTLRKGGRSIGAFERMMSQFLSVPHEDTRNGNMDGGRTERR